MTDHINSDSFQEDATIIDSQNFLIIGPTITTKINTQFQQAVTREATNGNIVFQYVQNNYQFFTDQLAYLNSVLALVTPAEISKIKYHRNLVNYMNYLNATTTAQIQALNLFKNDVTYYYNLLYVPQLPALSPLSFLKKPTTQKMSYEPHLETLKIIRSKNTNRNIKVDEKKLIHIPFTVAAPALKTTAPVVTTASAAVKVSTALTNISTLLPPPTVADIAATAAATRPTYVENISRILTLIFMIQNGIVNTKIIFGGYNYATNHQDYADNSHDTLAANYIPSTTLLSSTSYAARSLLQYGDVTSTTGINASQTISTLISSTLNTVNLTNFYTNNPQGSGVYTGPLPNNVWATINNSNKYSVQYNTNTPLVTTNTVKLNVLSPTGNNPSIPSYATMYDDAGLIQYIASADTLSSGSNIAYYGGVTDGYPHFNLLKYLFILGWAYSVAASIPSSCTGPGIPSGSCAGPSSISVQDACLAYGGVILPNINGPLYPISFPYPPVLDTNIFPSVMQTLIPNMINKVKYSAT
jgi:hypothetical protein